MTLAFASAAFLSAFLALKLRGAYGVSLKPLAIALFSIEVALLASAWAVGIHFESHFDESIVDLNDWKVILVGSLMGAAMGSHNAAAKESITGCPATTVMTTTLVNLSCALSNTLTLYLAAIPLHRLTPPNGPNGSYLAFTDSEREASNKATNESFVKFLIIFKPFVTFLAGSIIGALAMTHITFHSLSIPIAILLFIITEIYILILREDSANECLPIASSVQFPVVSQVR